MYEQAMSKIPLLISRSKISTEGHKTGEWRFVTPSFKEKTAPCRATCPVGEDIPRIGMIASRGLIKEAWETIMAENPFPCVCGHVCFHPCETACNRAFLDESVAVHHLERMIGEAGISEGFSASVLKTPSNGKRVAVVGSGPSGLSAAYFLSMLGFSCDLFESKDQPGGILRWGIPAYRLPEWVLQNEILRVEHMGVRIHCNTRITPERIGEIMDNYSALFMGYGHGRSVTMGIPGEEMAADGLDFLLEIRRGNLPAMDGIAAVIGGGNAAIDVSRSLIRLGAKPLIIYRRSLADMPAFSKEVNAALDEGVQIMETAVPVRIEEEDGNLMLRLQKMRAIGKDPEGRSRVVPDDSAPINLCVQHVFTAIGAQSDGILNPKEEGNDRAIPLSHSMFTLSKIPVIYGGDLTNAKRSVSDAIASGKQAAMAIDTYFHHGFDAIRERLNVSRVGDRDPLSMAIYLETDRASRSPKVISYSDINTDYFSNTPRHIPQTIPMLRGELSFMVKEPVFSLKEGVGEASRCFHCGICNDCDNCRIFCPDISVSCLENGRRINLDYCKGCGICVAECPSGVMELEEEQP